MASENKPSTNDQFSSAHIGPASSLPPTIKAWKIYLEDQAVSIHTVKAFKSDLNLLAAYFPPDKTLGEISTNDLLQFLDWLVDGRGVACSPKSLARRITSLKAFFRWLYQFGALIIDPAEKVPQKTVISPLPQALTEAETNKVIEAANAHRLSQKPDARIYALAVLLLETGIKKGECLALNLNHLEFEAADGPFLYVRYASPSSRYKERKIALSENWITAYHEYVAQYQVKDQLFPWSQRRLEYLLEDLGVEAGLNKHLSFDMCRWTCALNDLRAGVEPNKIRQKLGVSKIQWREISLKLEQLSRH
jgi:site-specific recombinase XerD